MMDWDKIVELIPPVVDELKANYVLKNSIIRDDIFGILEKHCTVVYYPLEEEDNCGFHTKRFVKDKREDFVYINTAKPIADQVFAAAHELGHVWKVTDKILGQLPDYDALEEEKEELLINRFAAELLMPQAEFRKTFFAHLKELHLEANRIKMEDLIRVAVMQMNDYKVPYESVRRRMIETKIISPQVGEILEKNKKIIGIWVAAFSKDLNTMLDKVTEKKTIPGLRNLIERIEKEQLLDEYTICKIKKDFDISTIDRADEMLNIITEDKTDGEN